MHPTMVDLKGRGEFPALCLALRSVVYAAGVTNPRQIGTPVAAQPAAATLLTPIGRRSCS